MLTLSFRVTCDAFSHTELPPHTLYRAGDAACLQLFQGQTIDSLEHIPFLGSFTRIHGAREGLLRILRKESLPIVTTSNVPATHAP